MGAPSDLAYVLTERARLALLERKPAQALAAVDKARVGGRGRARHGPGAVPQGASPGYEPPARRGDGHPPRGGRSSSSHGARQQEAAGWRELGELYEKQGRQDEALDAMRTGLDALDPTRSRA